MTLYSNFFSNAIESVETKENQVLITYSSNIGKEYVINTWFSLVSTLSIAFEKKLEYNVINL